jgi:hypothetical protein
VNGQAKTGELKVKTFSGTVAEGNTVKVAGKVFPTRAKPGYQISYAQVELLKAEQPFLVQLKQTFYKGIDRSLPDPTAGFVKGILVGARTSLPQASQDMLNGIGLSHVVAVSGYNLTILVVLMQRILKRKWRWGSFDFFDWPNCNLYAANRRFGLNCESCYYGNSIFDS